MDQTFRFPQPDNLNGLEIVDEFGSFTLSQRHMGKWVRQNSASATTVTVPVMPGLPRGCNCIVEAYGAGTVTVAGIGGLTGQPSLHPRGTYATSIVSAGQYAVIGMFSEGANVWSVSGDCTVT